MTFLLYARTDVSTAISRFDTINGWFSTVSIEEPFYFRFFCLTALFFSGVYSRLGLDPRGSSKAEPLWIAGAVPKVSH